MSRTYRSIRPRWTVKYVLCALLTIYTLTCFIFDMPLLSSKLPAYSGQYGVGTIDLEVPCEKRVISDTVLKDSRKPAFEVDTVLFSLYYPAVKNSPTRAPHHPWTPKPIALQAEGYARFAKMNNWFATQMFTFTLWSMTGSTTIPADVDVPLHGTGPSLASPGTEQPLKDKNGPSTFPVIVFSHGMASSRTSYTQYCGELASQGFIVAAIEHRDGSVPGTIVMNGSHVRNMLHITPELLDPQPEIYDFKKMQLATRQAEVEETVRVLRAINAGEGDRIFQKNPRMEGQDLAAWRGRLSVDRMVLAGHSYGATLALQALKGSPSEARPFVGGVILDPGKHSGPLNGDIDVPIIVVHSQSWSARHTIFHGRPHFSVVKELVQKIVDDKKKFGWFMTAKGTTHPSLTDAPLIEPFLLSWTTGSTIDAHDGVLQYVKITHRFMQYVDDGRPRGVLKEHVTHPEYDQDIRDEERKEAQDPDVEKYWQIHVAPENIGSQP